jgi:SRSO17 transposase
MDLVTEQLDPGVLERLEGFVRPVLRCVENRRARRLAGQYLTGLLGPGERKTVEPIVQRLLGAVSAPTAERRMREMLSDGAWNHATMMWAGTARLMEQTDGWQAYTLDDTSLLKQGEHSVGVANQYAGCVGGLANCQALVTAGVANEFVSSLVAARLFLPESWFKPEVADKRDRCHLPAGVRHRKKWEIGLDLARRPVRESLPRLPWLCDAGYGVATEFRVGMTEAGESYVAGIPLDVTVWAPGTTFSPMVRASLTRAGRPPHRLRVDQDRKPQTIVTFATGLPPDAWQQVCWRHGSRGPQIGRFAALRVRPARGHKGGGVHPDALLAEEWLLIHWPLDEPAPTKAWFSNLPPETEIAQLVGLARLRWRIERDHEEGKGLLGLDHYEGRTWQGLHHHVALVILAQQFLALERWHALRTAQPPPVTIPSPSPSTDPAPEPSTDMVDPPPRADFRRARSPSAAP